MYYNEEPISLESMCVKDEQNGTVEDSENIVWSQITTIVRPRAELIEKNDDARS